MILEWNESQSNSNNESNNNSDKWNDKASKTLMNSTNDKSNGNSMSDPWQPDSNGNSKDMLVTGLNSFSKRENSDNTDNQRQKVSEAKESDSDGKLIWLKVFECFIS